MRISSIRCRCGEALDVELLHDGNSRDTIIETHVKRWFEPKGDFVNVGQTAFVENMHARTHPVTALRTHGEHVDKHTAGFLAAWSAMHESCRELIDDPMTVLCDPYYYTGGRA